MNTPMILRRGGALLLAALALPAFASVPLASRDADRQAKSAAPGARETLIYVYRAEDKSTAPLAVTVKGQDAVQLAPRTFALWRLRPGRAQISVERSTSTLTIAGEAERVYYVELARSKSGVAVVRPVSFATGRTQVYRSQLVAQARRAAPSPKRATRSVEHAGTTGSFMLKLGSLSLSTGTTALASSSGTYAQQFQDSSASTVGLEGEWLMRPNLSLGAELLKYSNDFTGTPGPGSADVLVALFNVKRYFQPDSEWQPFIGVGIGTAVASYSGALTGDTSGIALQAVGGVQWRRDKFALRGEFKYLSAETEEDGGQKADYSGSGVFISAGFYF